VQNLLKFFELIYIDMYLLFRLLKDIVIFSGDHIIYDYEYVRNYLDKHTPFLITVSGSFVSMSEVGIPNGY